MPVYEILINEGCSVKDPFIYNYANTRNIELHIRKDKAAVRYKMSVAKSPEELIKLKCKVFKDAYRKLFLLHGILFDRNIRVRTLTISVGEEKAVYNKETEGFPFLYSMISETPMCLSEPWKSKEFCQQLIKNPKSKSNNDFKQISVLAFLCSKGHPYVIDRFTNLWTSMNAYYNWYADLYNEHFRKLYHYDREYFEALSKKIPAEKKNEFDRLRNETLTSNREYPFIVSGDANCINLLMESIKKSGEHINTEQFKKDSALRSKLHRFESKLSALSEDELEKLYAYAVSLLKGKQPAAGDEFYDILELVKGMNRQSLYFFLVFEHPYMCRCNYLHGSKALLLLAYENEPEIRLLKAASFFVERFLLERIPAMITGETVLSEDILIEREKKIKPDMLERLERHKIAAENLMDNCRAIKD